MTDHFNRLSPPEVERLAILAEECAEIIQIVNKILRHGYESSHPDGGFSNRELLEHEMGDVQFAMTLLARHSDVLEHRVLHRAEDKKAFIRPYLHYEVNSK